MGIGVSVLVECAMGQPNPARGWVGKENNKRGFDQFLEGLGRMSGWDPPPWELGKLGPSIGRHTFQSVDSCRVVERFLYQSLSNLTAHHDIV